MTAIEAKSLTLRHYEIIFLVHPDQSEQVPAMVERYSQLIRSDGGQIHRLEDWGRRQLAYPIGKIMKAHYILMNVECSEPVLNQIEDAFRYNDAVIRKLVLRKDKPITTSSPVARERENKSSHDDIGEARAK